jgi:thiol-disulfide isomerase/thioredoxin
MSCQPPCPPPWSLRRRELVAAGVASLWSLAPASTWAQAEAAGRRQPAPPDSFGADTPLGRDRDDKPLKLGDLQGRALVVCFWASWCPHCRAELLVLERIQQSVSPERLRVLLVNTEPLSDWRKVRRRLDGQMQSQLTHDAEGQSVKAFGAPNSVPYTTVIARDGRSQATLSGWSDDRLEWLVGHVNQALAAPKS